MIKCDAFDMQNPNEALKHIRDNWEVVEDYGSELYNHHLYVFDDGGRILGRCKKCEQLILLQSSEFHSFSDDGDSYYSDYFPVSSIEEAEKLNELYDGHQIESKFKDKWLCKTNSYSIWKNSD